MTWRQVNLRGWNKAHHVSRTTAVWKHQVSAKRAQVSRSSTINSSGTVSDRVSALLNQYITKGSMSEDDQNLSNHQHLQSATPSIKELEHVLDSCRVELNHVDEVWPNLYLGDIVIAHDKEELRKRGITHVLNAAHSAWESKGDQAFYGQDIHYCGIAAEDSNDFNLRVHFYPASAYINKALSAPNGKILVHCVLGKSRSASLVLAYLMIYHHFSLTDAVQRVIQHRAVSPNRGFLTQLQDLDIELQDKTNQSQGDPVNISAVMERSLFPMNRYL